MSVKIGRFLIRSGMPITVEELRMLNKRDPAAVELARSKVIRGIWTILEVQ